MNEWISVQDRLPETEKDVNVYGKIGYYGKDPNKRFAYKVGTARLVYANVNYFSVPSFCCGIESELDIYDITHWQELPPPPIGHQ